MLFNKLIGRRVSIVEDTPGVTRDRIYGETDWCGRKFTLIDTGGIEPRTDDQILGFMREQAKIAIENANVIIFLTDIRTGLTAADHEVANMLLRSNKPIVLGVNKMTPPARWIRISTNSITSALAIPLLFLLCMVMEPVTFWMPACSISRRKTRKKRKTMPLRWR
jgi:small GTP-binding protein